MSKTIGEWHVFDSHSLQLLCAHFLIQISFSFTPQEGIYMHEHEEARH